MSQTDLSSVISTIEKNGGVFNSRYSDGRWQIQIVQGNMALTGTGDTMDEAIHDAMSKSTN